MPQLPHPRACALALAFALSACGQADGGGAGATMSGSARQLASTTVGGVVAFPGARGRYTISASGGGYLVTDLEQGGSTSLNASQRAQFADVTVAFGATGNPAQAYRLYQAAFNRTPDSAGLGFWISMLDNGVPLGEVAAAFVASAEFKALVGTNPTTAQFVTALYANVLHRAPDAGGFGYWSNILDTKADTQANVLRQFSESPENQGAVAAAIANGIAYTPTTRVASTTVPAAPVIGAVTAGNASLSVAFAASTSDGGSAILGYAAACSAGGAAHMASGATSPIVVTGLTNGTVYACTVKATNALGSSALSAAVNASPSANGSATAPGAPTIGSASAGSGSATISFTAPASNGGAAITTYTATCSAGAASKTGTGTASPVTVSGLTNGTAYACAVTATNAAGTGSSSASVNVTPGSSGGAGGSSLTGSVFCNTSASVQNPTVSLVSTVASTCTTTARTITGNGVPDHEVGSFPNAGNPNTIAAVNVNFTNTLNPAVVSSTGTAVAHILGFANNGVKFDPSTAESYQNAGVWKIEALNQTYFAFGVDSSNAHVQPDGAYHYHGMPEKYIAKLGKGSAMTLVGFAVDGFPIYARYGYTTATDANSALKVMTSSYRLKTTPASGRPSTAAVPMGTFTQDYEYVAGLGDLDECNGRTGVTPEFPNGIYHYYITDSYPYIQRCVKGTAASTGP